MDKFRYKLEQRRIEREKFSEESIKKDSKKIQTLSSDEKILIEKNLISYLNDPLIDLPINSEDLLYKLSLSFENCIINRDFFNKLLIKLSLTYKLIKIKEICPKIKSHDENFKPFLILNADLLKIEAYQKKILKEFGYGDFGQNVESIKSNNKLAKKGSFEFLENLISEPSALEIESRKHRAEINQLLIKSTILEKREMTNHKSVKSHVQEYCPYGTKDECFRIHYNKNILHKKCDKIHFRRILKVHTDITLGDCSFLNTCYNINSCKYIHYEVDMQDVDPEITLNSQMINNTMLLENYPPQWVQCDLRSFDMDVLGKFSVIMADPPWDIHMELPYGTMADEEMKKLDIPSLQDDGYIFLWVTGRAMELGRECLKEWNYERVDELIWVKTNQLQRIIRTGRTGHWLNHGKEHCLVGVKGKPNPALFSKGIDCDIIVAEVRATSHKPDEVYSVIERLSPGTRKVELFGRPHNVKPNWVTLGNQLDGVRLMEPEVVKRYKAKYPDGNCMPQIANKD